MCKNTSPLSSRHFASGRRGRRRGPAPPCPWPADPRRRSTDGAGSCASSSGEAGLLAPGAAMRCTPKSIVGAAALSSHRGRGGSPQRLGSAGLGLAGRELAGRGSAAALLPRRGEGHSAVGPSSRRLPPSPGRRRSRGARRSGGGSVSIRPLASIRRRRVDPSARLVRSAWPRRSLLAEPSSNHVADRRGHRVHGVRSRLCPPRHRLRAGEGRAAGTVVAGARAGGEGRGRRRRLRVSYGHWREEGRGQRRRQMEGSEREAAAEDGRDFASAVGERFVLRAMQTL